MPSIDELQKKQKERAFKKKTYRPWLDLDTSEPAEKKEPQEENSAQSTDKVSTNSVQSTDKPPTNSVQTPHKGSTNSVQEVPQEEVIAEITVVPTPLAPSEFEPNSVQTPHKGSTFSVQSTYKGRTNSTQSSYKPSTKSVQTTDNLSTEESPSTSAASLNEELVRQSTEINGSPFLKASPPLSDSDPKSPTVNSAQSTYNPRTKVEQTPYKGRTKAVQTPTTAYVNSVQTSDKVSTELRTELCQNSVQSTYNGTDLKSKIPRFTTLTGKRRGMVLFIYESCKAARSPMSDPFTLDALCAACDTTHYTADGTLRRLVKEGILQKIESKIGRGAWHIFALPDDIYQEMLRLDSSGKLYGNSVQTSDKVRTQLSTELSTSPPSSSSDLNMYKTTTEEKAVDKPTQLPTEWDEIDFSCLESIHFRKDHIKQIYAAGKVTSEVVQNSIYELHHDLTSGGQHGLRSPLNVFMKALRIKGESYTATTPGYVSDELKYERKRLEELKRRNAELTQLQQEEVQLQTLPARLQDDAQFDAWRQNLTSEQRREYAPSAQQEGSRMQIGLLRDHWERIKGVSSEHSQDSDDSDEEKLREEIRRQIDLSLLGVITE